MPLASCRECDFEFVEMIEREVVEGEVYQHFWCPECGGRWSNAM